MTNSENTQAADRILDMGDVLRLLAKATRIAENLDGQVHDNARAVTEQSKGAARQERARRDKEMGRLRHLLRYADVLVEDEYWITRGNRGALG